MLANRILYAYSTVANGISIIPTVKHPAERHEDLAVIATIPRFDAPQTQEVGNLCDFALPLSVLPTISDFISGFRKLSIRSVPLLA